MKIATDNSIQKIGRYAQRIINEGASVEDLAREENTNVEDINKVLSRLASINPNLYRKVQENL